MEPLNHFFFSKIQEAVKTHQRSPLCKKFNHSEALEKIMFGKKQTRGNLTKTLNLKIIGIVFLLMILVTIHSHWLAMSQENETNMRYLVTVTNFLKKQTPPNIFTETAENTSPQEQAQLLRERLQPVLGNVCLSNSVIKYGYYSVRSDKIVILGPQFDSALYHTVEEHQLSALHEGASSHFVEAPSPLWYGGKTLFYTTPIKENETIVGYVFSMISQENVATLIWIRTLNTFMGALIMLMICILVFRELFINMKKDLSEFAERILTGDAYNYKCRLPEFTPILNYINEQTDKMMRLDRLNLIGEMAAGIAHEIRNPMTTVKGLLQFIGNKKEFSAHKDNFNLMVDEIDRANDIISTFLSLSKNRSMQFETSNLNTVIEDVYPMLKATVSMHDCNLQLNLGPIPDINLDSNSIRQFILNMVRNAIDAMPDGGDVEIRTHTAGDKIFLTVKDNGLGIPTEIKEKLGTPFFTTKENGTGLGLAICYRIAQRHAAHLLVDSEPGKGTAFTLQFKYTRICAVS